MIAAIKAPVRGAGKDRVRRPSEVAAAVDELIAALEGADFSGWDPYDALSSRLIHVLARGRLARRVAIQVLKRTPINLRPALGVPRQRHIMAVGLMTSAFATLARYDGSGIHEARVRMLAQELLARSIPFEAGLGWSYDFDVQTRWSFYPRGVPNAIATVFAASGLQDAGELLGEQSFCSAARLAAEFACSSLMTEVDGERFFGYFPGSDTRIHNANLLTSALVARCADPDSSAFARAADAARYTVVRQRADGSWPYGEERHLQWVDGYHTAFCLDALAVWEDHGARDLASEPLRRGLDLYLTGLIDADGAPRATLGSRFPIDIHGAAFAIACLSRLREHDERCGPIASRVLGWTLDEMRRADGGFAFQLHRLYRISIPYVRWSDAPMLSAMAAHLEAGDADSDAVFKSDRRMEDERTWQR